MGAVLLPINCGNGNGLAIEPHPLIVARVDLVCPCRPRRQDKCEQRKHYLGYASGGLRLRLSATPFRLLGEHHAARSGSHSRRPAPGEMMRPSCYPRIPTAFGFRTVHADPAGLCRHWADMLECHKPSSIAVVAP